MTGIRSRGQDGFRSFFKPPQTAEKRLHLRSGKRVTPYLSDGRFYHPAMMQREYIAGRFPGRGLDEINGYAGLGMFVEALLAARKLLQQTVLSAEAFEASVKMVLSDADDLGAWEKTVRSAYHRLTKEGRRRNGFLMLWFYAACEDHARAVHFIPGKFSGPFALVNLWVAMNTYVGLGRLDKAQRLLPRCQRGARAASHPELRKMLSEVLADYRREVDLLRAHQSEHEKWKSLVGGTSSTSP